MSEPRPTHRGRRLRDWVWIPADVPPFRQGSFRSRVHDPRPASWLGIALGVAFATCFATGMVSHLVQAGGSLLDHDVVNGGGWTVWPTAGAGLYRITQGLHVATGIATFPLLLAKLFVVYPQLYAWPPVRGVRHAIERATLPLLVGGSLLLLLTGAQNVMYWYPWGFFFPVGHYWAAWVTIGALLVHIGAKATTARRAIGGGLPDDGDDAPAADGTVPAAGGLTRRTVLTGAAAASGLVTLAYAGGTVAPLARFAVLNAREPTTGPQGFPVNKSAAASRVTAAATDPAYRLRVTGAVERELALSLADLRALPWHTAVLPIACVEGWSVSKRWSGISVATLLRRAGAAHGASVRISSLQSGGLYRACDLTPALAADPDTLLALEVEGEQLHLDHGFPVRLIAPNNPGVLQTKWVGAVVVR